MQASGEGTRRFAPRTPSSSGRSRNAATHWIPKQGSSQPDKVVNAYQVTSATRLTCVKPGRGTHLGRAGRGRRRAGGAPSRVDIRSFLESLPFMATSALLCLHWDQIAGARQGRTGSAEILWRCARAKETLASSPARGPVRIRRTTHRATGNLKISVTRVPQGPERARIWFAARRAIQRP